MLGAIIGDRYGYDLGKGWAYWHVVYDWEDSCQGTVPQAIIAFLDSESFEDAIRKAVSLDGDSDTLACITGGITEAYYGLVPATLADPALERLPDEFKDLLRRSKALPLKECYDFIKRFSSGALRIGGAIAKGNHRHHRFLVGDAEDAAERLGIPHAHDERVKAHGAGLQDKMRIAEAVVVGSPAVSHFVGGFAPSAESRLPADIGGNDEDGGAFRVLFVPLADDLADGIGLLLRQGYIVTARLGIGP